jgi:hypothetical protein
MLPIFEFISGLVKPVAELISDLHTNKTEAGQIQVALGQVQIQLANLQVGFAAKAMEYETKLLESQTELVKAEAQGASTIQRTWRPITMLTFVGLVTFNVVARTFGFSQFELPPDLWLLIQIGLGGYVGGRTLEKIIPGVVSAVGAVRVGGAK